MQLWTIYIVSNWKFKSWSGSQADGTGVSTQLCGSFNSLYAGVSIDN
jgi:hypothetical protein